MNRITEVKLALHPEGWQIEVTKEFAPEYGGGSQVFKQWGGEEIHEALRRAAYMVTLTPGTAELARERGWEEINPDPPASHDYDSDGEPQRHGPHPEAR